MTTEQEMSHKDWVMSGWRWWIVFIGIIGCNIELWEHWGPAWFKGAIDLVFFVGGLLVLYRIGCWIIRQVRPNENGR